MKHTHTMNVFYFFLTLFNEYARFLKDFNLGGQYFMMFIDVLLISYNFLF